MTVKGYVLNEIIRILETKTIDPIKKFEAITVLVEAFIRVFKEKASTLYQIKEKTQSALTTLSLS